MCLLWVYSHCSPKEESQNLDTGSLQLADFCEYTTELCELPKSWWSFYMLIGETELSEVQTLCDTCVREEEQSYLRKQFLSDLHRFRCFQYSLSSVLRQPKILLLTANGVCLGEGLKCSIWELWCCGLEFYLLSHELSLPRVMADAAAKSALAAGLGILWAPSQVQEEMLVLSFRVGP